MKFFLKKSAGAVVLLILPLFLAGCITRVKNEIPLAGGDLSVKAASTNDTKLVIFNDSNVVLFGVDGSGRVNVSLNGKGVARIGIGSYVQVIVPRGRYQVDLAHLDLVKFHSHHQIDLNGPESFLEINATTVSNEAKLVPELPPDFLKRFQPLRNAMLTYTVQIRRMSHADNRAFNDQVIGIGGVGYTDETLFPGAKVRTITQIEVIVPYNSRRTGVERWIVQHDGQDTCSYIVKFIPDGHGGTTFETQKDDGSTK